MNTIAKFIVNYFVILCNMLLHIQKGSFACCINGKELSEDNEIALNDGCANQTLKEQNHDADNNNNNNNVNNNSVANQTGQSVQSNKPKKKAFLTRSMTVNDPKKAKESEE